MGELIDNINVKVDASLLVYNEETEELEQTMILATDLPNIGFAQVQLPTSPIFPASQYDVHAGILQLSVNTSTTIMPVNKRAAHHSILKRVLPWAKKFTKVKMVSFKKFFVAKRRKLCAEWAATTLPVLPRSIPSCPCTTNDAASDTRFVEEETPELVRLFFHKGSSTCYRQANVRYDSVHAIKGI
jgi:hypothetical protein